MRTRFSLVVLLVIALGMPVVASADLDAVLRGLSYTERDGFGFSMVEPDAMATDQAAVVVTGRLWGSVDFDPGPRRVILTSGHGHNTFVASYSRAGRLQWARSFFGLANEPSDIAVDDAGNVIVVGEYFGTLEVGDRRSSEQLIAPGQSNDGYVVKLDRRGRLLWARAYGENGSEAGSVACDSAGSIWVAGRAHRPTSLLRFDAEGNVTWSATIGFDPFQIAVAPDDTIYLTGRFAPGVDFDPGPAYQTLPGAGYLDAFVARLTSDGDLMWAVPAGGPGADFGNRILFDADGAVTVLGRFVGEADFDPEPTRSAIVSGGSGAPFLWTLTPEGRLVRALALFVGQRVWTLDVAMKEDGNLMLTGFFTGDLTFPDGQILSTGVHWEGLVFELLPDGEILSAGRAGGHSTDSAKAIGTIGRETYVAGFFESRPADLDPSDGEALVNPDGRRELFLMRLQPSR